MSNRQINDREGHAHFITFGCFRRRRLLDHPLLRDTLISIFADKLSDHKGICSGFVVMPDHMHAILWFPEEGDLSRMMKSWKQTSSLRLKKLARGVIPHYLSHIPNTDAFWQPKYYPFNLYSEKKAREKLDYINLNPVRAGLVERAIDWRWGSARYFELGEPVGVPIQWIFS